jgi:predicted amidohydrolase
MTKVAAVQQDAALADVTANLTMCERLVDAAAEAGAEIIVLPEFFPTGMGFLPALVCAPRPPSRGGAAAGVMY